MLCSNSKNIMSTSSLKILRRGDEIKLQGKMQFACFLQSELITNYNKFVVDELTDDYR